MKNDFDYKSVPPNFAHCFNDQCKKTDNCLRHLAGKNNTPDKSFGSYYPNFLTNKGKGIATACNIDHCNTLCPSYQ